MSMKKMGYKAFGFILTSDIHLPELPLMHLDREKPDVVIMQVDLTDLWFELAEEDEQFIIQPDFIMFQVPDVAIYCIRNGNEIFVSPITNHVEDQIRLYLLGTCMGAVLLQRRVLPLHGSAVVVDGCAYAIVGDSGAGKSTLASAFLQRGYQFMSDDVIPVTLSYKSSPIVTPAYPQQKLWKNSLHQFGVNTADLFPIIDREEKFAVPISTQFAKNQVPLAGVFELMKTGDDVIKVNSMQNLERLFKLFYHTYRPFFVEPLHLLEWHFNICTKVISSVRMYQLYRPSSGFTANELVDIMLSTIKVKERAH